MKNAKKTELTERRGTAAEAKAALLQAYRAAKEAAEPLRKAKQQEHIILAEAREARRVAREQAKLEEQVRLDAEIHERARTIAAATTAEADARERLHDQRIARVIGDEAMRKAMRDQRYANRKARQG